MTDLSAKIRDSFRGKRILIAGDLVADQFLHGTIARVSREAPVFILRHDETDTRAGAAANAAVNVAALGGVPLLVGIIGDDEAGRLLIDSLERSGVDAQHLVVDDSRKTTTKLRVLAGQHYAARQQVIRIDYENKADVGPAVREKLSSKFAETAAGADAIIVSDYNCGAIGEGLFRLATERAAERSIPLLADSRYRLTEFAGATTATPNQEEAEQIIGGEVSVEKCEALRERLNLGSLLVTRGNKGMLLIEKDCEPLSLAAIGPTEPVDVTGAGDTVIAVYALGLASGLNCPDAAAAANHAGGIVVMKKGTASVSMDELLESIRLHSTPASLEFSA
jgi:D-glycero-beta-D-manno-heptose-7-phosphate kinase